MPSPLVSICIPTYKGDEFIGDAIQSVLDQSYQSFEIIVVDDCSPDGTAAVINRFSDDRINYYKNETNLGPEGNWNRCLELINGKYYKLLPHDDVLIADCIQSQVEVLEADNDKQIALVFGGKAIIDSRGKRLLTRYPLGKKSLRLSANDLINKCIKSGSNIIGEPGNGLIRSELAAEIGRYDDTYPYVIDLDYWFRALLHGDAYYTGQISSCFRISEQAWSTRIGKKQHDDYFGMIEKYSSDPRYKISTFSKILGKMNSYIISFGRRVLYVVLRFSNTQNSPKKGHQKDI